MDNNAVALKLYKDGMVVYLNEGVSFNDLKAEVVEKFKESDGFFEGGTHNIGFGGAKLEKAQYDELISEISKVLNSEVSFWENPTVLEDKDDQTPEQLLNSAMMIDIDSRDTKFYNKTLRSGQILESEGHAVIVGDINPGAEVVAAGNIFVMGSVKGTIHAGAKGDRDAIAIALNLSPTQLRIADIIARSPDGDENNSINPEIAYVKDNKIFIKDFLQKKK